MSAKQGKTKKKDQTVTRRRGRPRKQGNSLDPKKEQIIDTARTLFRTQGYAKTTMAHIAAAADLEPSSLYYHFSNKEEILARIINFPHSERIISLIAKAPATAAERLYALIVHDVQIKCQMPFDFIEFETVINDRPDQFHELRDLYRALYQALVHTIQEGQANNEFVACDAEVKAVAILSINDGLQHHYHAKIRKEIILEYAGYQVKNFSPQEIGQLSAEACIPSLLMGVPDLNDLALRSKELYVTITSQVN